jgi:hypothetical protein
MSSYSAARPAARSETLRPSVRARRVAPDGDRFLIEGGALAAGYDPPRTPGGAGTHPGGAGTHPGGAGTHPRWFVPSDHCYA